MFWLGSGRVNALNTVSNKGPPINFERRAESGAAGDRKVNGFQLKTFDKVSILYPGSLGTVSGQFWGPRDGKKKH